MLNHHFSAFANSCLKVPVDPISKMPKTAYERKKLATRKISIDSVSTSSVSTADVDAEKLKEFYRSIPDYNDINHLPTEQFYLTVNTLREKKKVMLGIAVEHIEECPRHRKPNDDVLDISVSVTPDVMSNNIHQIKNKRVLRSKAPSDKERYEGRRKNISDKLSTEPNISTLKRTNSAMKTNFHKRYEITKRLSDEEKENKDKNDRLRRNYSACSITWDDAIEPKTEVDRKFDSFFDGRKYTGPSKIDIGEEYKTQSMPSSPLRTKRALSPLRRRKSITTPKPFKMTERDEEERMVNELRSIQKSFSEDMLHQKCERRQFKANPVPIESRIPLYDKILEDQAMRRAIAKINSEADLRAQMKPFSFTKREEKGIDKSCNRATNSLPKCKKKKKFRARPVPRNLFSNYFYSKMREEQFFKGLNRRIRAEEMLRNASLPGTMATRDRSRLSTPGAHSDLPIDPSPAPQSISSSGRNRCTSPMKKKRDKCTKEDFITTSPQPFKFNTAERAAKKMEDVVRKIYEEKSTVSGGDTGAGGKAYSALDLRAASTGRSNLASLLRAEAIRRKFEIESAMRLAEQKRKNEIKHRDRLLRSKPAWHLVKNNYEEDIAMRLQTRRDEERMRREEFLHEMELMYGRVQQQPMLFERYYAPRSYSADIDSLHLSPRKSRKNNNKKDCYGSPGRSRKVSINDNTETFNGDVEDYLNRINDDLSESEVAINSEMEKSNR